MLLAVKSVWQYYVSSSDVLRLLEGFRRMVNDSLRIGLVNDVSSLRKLSLLSYNQLAHYDSPSYYKLCAISRAAGILAARRKSIRRGFTNRTPYAFTTSPLLLRVQNRERIFAYSCLEREAFQHTLDQTYVRHRISTRGQGSLFHPHLEQTESLHRPRHSHDECASTVGVDCNLRNLAVGNDDQTTHYDLSKTVRIASTTTRIVASFTRDDNRIKTRIASKYGGRRISRTAHLLHNATKTIVALAVQRRTAVVLENIEGIRSLYRKGNGQGRKYRGRMNEWSFGDAQRQIEYKSRWVGLPAIRLSRRETRGSSVTCPRCGERLQSDKRLTRKLWCGKCRIVMDRDRVAGINLAWRGRVRFARSRPPITEAQGGADEAMKGNPTPMVIPGVDAPKLTQPTKS